MEKSLSEKAKLSVLWNTGFNLFRDGLQFCVMLVLVRLLDPEAYGQFGMATSVIGFISVFAFHNFVAYTMQVRREEETHYQIHFTAGSIIQISLFIFTNIVAFYLKSSERYSPIAPLVHILSITFLLEWPTELCIKMLERELDWKTRRILHGVGLIISSIVAIIMGYKGLGVYALIFPGLLVTLPFIYELFFVRNWRPTWEWNPEKFKPALHFGLSRLGSGFLNKARPLLESTLIVQFISFAGVGLLGRAIGLATLVCQRLAIQLMYAIYPVLTRVEPGTNQYRRMSILIIRVVAWTVIPTATIFSILATPVVKTVYGDKWLDVIELLPWAMLLSALGSLMHVVYMLLLAHNEQRICLWVDIFVFLGNVVLLFLALPSGLVVYVQAMSILHILAFVIICYFLIKVVGLNSKIILLAIMPPIFFSVCATALPYVSFSLLKINLLGLWISLLFGLIFLFTYLIMIRFFLKEDLAEVIGYMPLNKSISRVFCL